MLLLAGGGAIEGPQAIWSAVTVEKARGWDGGDGGPGGQRATQEGKTMDVDPGQNWAFLTWTLRFSMDLGIDLETVWGSGTGLNSEDQARPPHPSGVALRKSLPLTESPVPVSCDGDNNMHPRGLWGDAG